MRGSKWSTSETNALELLYLAGWRWAAISAHVSGIHGKQRTETSCQRKAGSIGIIRRDRLHWRRIPGDYNDDIKDMMVLDYSTTQIAGELSQQYGRRFTQAWVHCRLVEIGGAEYTGWQRRANDRQSRANTRAWMTRRSA